MIIACGFCGKLRDVKHKGTPEEIEADIHKTIGIEGWRFVKSYNGYICSACRKDNPDKLYVAFVGKPKPMSKEDSYRHLLIDVVTLIKELNSME